MFKVCLLIEFKRLYVEIFIGVWSSFRIFCKCLYKIRKEEKSMSLIMIMYNFRGNVISFVVLVRLYGCVIFFW